MRESVKLFCGCRVFVFRNEPQLGETLIDWCSIHRAAPELLEALEDLLKRFETCARVAGNDAISIKRATERHYSVLFKARGHKHQTDRIEREELIDDVARHLGVDRDEALRTFRQAVEELDEEETRSEQESRESDG